MRRDIGFGLFAHVPADWQFQEVDGVLEFLPPTDRAAAHISVYRRESEGQPEPGEAAWFAEAPDGCELTQPPVEVAVGSTLIARASYADPVKGARWDIASHVGPRRAVVFTYHDDGTEDESREAAKNLFESIHNEEP